MYRRQPDRRHGYPRRPHLAGAGSQRPQPGSDQLRHRRGYHERNAVAVLPGGSGQAAGISPSLWEGPTICGGGGKPIPFSAIFSPWSSRPATTASRRSSACPYRSMSLLPKPVISLRQGADMRALPPVLEKLLEALTRHAAESEVAVVDLHHPFLGKNQQVRSRPLFA
jgi:hypothetical protein